MDAATIAAGTERCVVRGRRAGPMPCSESTLGPTALGRRSGSRAQHLSTVKSSAAAHVWASAQGDGLVWRIDPGRDPVTRTIDISVGVTCIAYSDRAIWAAIYSDGTVSRIDAETSEVQETPIEAVRSLAAGEGSAWSGRHRGL